MEPRCTACTARLDYCAHTATDSACRIFPCRGTANGRHVDPRHVAAQELADAMRACTGSVAVTVIDQTRHLDGSLTTNAVAIAVAS